MRKWKWGQVPFHGSRDGKPCRWETVSGLVSNIRETRLRRGGSWPGASKKGDALLAAARACAIPRAAGNPGATAGLAAVEVANLSTSPTPGVATGESALACEVVRIVRRSHGLRIGLHAFRVTMLDVGMAFGGASSLLEKEESHNEGEAHDDGYSHCCHSLAKRTYL